ncbi:hypothetical protein MNV49_002523 [Pseudohyphozyma bogoriensis]|nr:hypothetical protein MNV49_002523 [Pseudohyphozyma bogoriensis]
MTVQPLTIVEATSSDLTRLSQIQFLAFEPSVINQKCFPGVSEATYVAHGAPRLAYNLEPHRKSKKMICAKRGEEIIGWALWDLPFDAEERKKESETVVPGEPWPVGTKVEYAEAIFGGFAENVKKHPEPHYHLHILVVDPAYHGSGAGGALLRWGIDKADAEGHGAVGYPMYQKFGFVDSGPLITAHNAPEMKAGMASLTAQASTMQDRRPVFVRTFDRAALWPPSRTGHPHTNPATRMELEIGDETRAKFSGDSEILFSSLGYFCAIRGVNYIITARHCILRFEASRDEVHQSGHGEEEAQRLVDPNWFTKKPLQIATTINVHRSAPYQLDMDNLAHELSGKFYTVWQNWVHTEFHNDLAVYPLLPSQAPPKLKWNSDLRNALDECLGLLFVAFAWHLKLITVD